MDAPGTAVEQFFDQLIRMKLLSQVVVSDRQGNTILACFTPPEGTQNGGLASAAGADTAAEAEATDDVNMPIESNVVLGGSRCYQHLEQFGLGLPTYISAQYHDAMVVHTVDRSALLTLIGHRSCGHMVGGLLALLPQIRAAAAYQELLVRIDECYQ